MPSPPARYPSGEILLRGRDVLKMSKAELRDIRGGVVSYVFQEPGASLNPVFRVGTQIKEALKVHAPLTPNLVAADVRRLITPNPKSGIRNPKSTRASSRRLLRFRGSMREIFRGNLSPGERAGVRASQPSNTPSLCRTASIWLVGLWPRIIR